jgi:hypothetical protein
VLRDDGTSEFHVMRSDTMVRGQRLRPGEEKHEEGTKHPSRSHGAPASGKPIIAPRLAFWVDTFKHVSTELLHCSK